MKKKMITKEELFKRYLREAYDLGKNDGWEVNFEELVKRWFENYESLEKAEKLLRCIK